MDIDTLFRRLYPPLHRYILRLTGDGDTADDIAQEAFVRLLRQSLPEAEAKPWLFAVATNLVRDGARKTSRRERILAIVRPAPAGASPPDALVERNERVAVVREALDRLKERDRRLLLMREEGFTYEEMARAVGVAPTSVGTLLARAVRRFSEAVSMNEVGYDARG